MWRMPSIFQRGLRRIIAICLLFLIFSTGAFAQEETVGRPQQAAAPRPAVRYTGTAVQNVTIRTERSIEADGVGQYRVGDDVEVLEYEPGWLYVVKDEGEHYVTGYVLRHTVHDVQAVPEEETPYGATPAAFHCVLTEDTALYAAPEAEGEPIRMMTAGTKLAVLSVEDGWGQVIFWRQPGYFYLDNAEALTPVYDVASAQSGDTIAAFISFYNLSERGLNPNRMLNIAIACDFISIPLASGEAFSFNAVAGPYRKTRGYLEAPSFVGGETVPSYGGGTCQVSSTLYNVLLPVGDGITILYRVAHGAGGISYLPHGVDAACGNTDIDLRFQNDYPFPVRIEASAHDGVLYIALLKD